MTQSLSGNLAGTDYPVVDGYAFVAGVWVPVRRGFVNDGSAWKQSFQDEAPYTLNSANSPVLKSLITAADWTNPLVRKRVTIPAGQEIVATNLSYALATTISADGQAGSFAGELIVDNYGTISGMGGAPNAGTGGDAVWGNYPGDLGQQMVLNNFGTIRSGAGAGGKGGQGGPGYYQSSYTAVEGPAYSSYGSATPYYWDSTYDSNNGDYTKLVWAGSVIYHVYGSYTTTSLVIGGYTYYRGSTSQSVDYLSNGVRNYYTIQRNHTAYADNYTTGGAGGNGGRGQGSDGANLGGSGGAGGGTNAGTGGTGGAGGLWGASGATGNTGASGNNGAGSAGSAGGLAGRYLNGSANILLNNFGTVQGRLN